MDLKRLKHVVALADERNFARAAERVHLSQPALSRSIQAAELELDIKLFDRGSMEVTPTPAGILVIERARKLLFESRCLERDIALFRKSQFGDLAFGVGPFPAATLLPALMLELRQRYAGVRLRVEVNNWDYLAQHLRNEELDFFVADVRDLPPDADLEIGLLARQLGGFYVRADHPLLRVGKVLAADICTYGLATVRLPKRIQEGVMQLLELAPGTALPFALECDDVATLKHTVLESDTVLAIIHAAVRAEVASGQLVLIELAGAPPMFSEMGIVSLRGRSQSPVGQFVIARLTELAAQASEIG
ncbi:MAG: LysR family transcriptional regulator [Burkholderiales bacterium]|nr:LysR family transcriptional regulator [Burkholderiales bacterium]